LYFLGKNTIIYSIVVLKQKSVKGDELMQLEKVKSTFKPIVEASKGAFSKVKNLKFNLKGLKLEKINLNLNIKQLKQLDFNKLSRKITNKKRFAFTVGSILLALILVMSVYFSGVAYAVSIDGSELGMVRNKKQVEDLLLQVKEEYKNENNAEISIGSQITYAKTRASSKELIGGAPLEQAIRDEVVFTIQSFSISANDNSIAAFKTKEEADQVLETIKSAYVKEENKASYKEITFAEKVEVKQEFNEKGKIMGAEEAANFILKGTDEVKIHKVVSGESIWGISRKYNISVDNLQKANPKLDPNKIKIGQELNLVVPKPLVSVKTTELVNYKENIPFEQKVEFSSSLYKDQTNTKVKGVYGERDIVAEVVKINGIEDSRNVVSEKVIKEPKTQVVVKGTKEVPAKKGTGTFKMPTRGSLSSRFGTRWGRAHEGIDLAAPIGTAVNAADGGVVIWVGTNSSYGKLIKVDHGGGYVTYYGHLSKYFVEKGDKVYKGQKIAAVGNTGRSTGPHLHFEIRKNGTPVNPLKYVN
jgi:murein DD-endopeptidase MepM/ murein hydrolase activator NlpD